MKEIGKVKVDKNGDITYLKREHYGQGKVYKNYRGLEDKNIVCYVPENEDYAYTFEEIINICEGREDRAKALFEFLNWQRPYTLYVQWHENGEWEYMEEDL